MPLGFQALRPHSHAGRFILAIATSLFAALLIVAWSPAQAGDTEAPLAEGPYFHIASADPSLDRLPLKSTRVDARVAGTVADVEDRLKRAGRAERLGHKAVRLCQQAHEQGGLLSNCDLAELLNRSDAEIAHVLTDHEKQTGQLVPRRATLHDVGTGLTHKRIICWKRYAEGKTADVVAKETYHDLESVDGYLGQFDRVRHCRQEGLTPEQTAYTLNCSVRLVKEYLAIDEELGQRGS